MFKACMRPSQPCAWAVAGLQALLSMRVLRGFADVRDRVQSRLEREHSHLQVFWRRCVWKACRWQQPDGQRQDGVHTPDIPERRGARPGWRRDRLLCQWSRSSASSSSHRAGIGSSAWLRLSAYFYIFYFCDVIRFSCSNFRMSKPHRLAPHRQGMPAT